MMKFPNPEMFLQELNYPDTPFVNLEEWVAKFDKYPTDLERAARHWTYLAGYIFENPGGNWIGQFESLTTFLVTWCDHRKSPNPEAIQSAFIAICAREKIPGLAFSIGQDPPKLSKAETETQILNGKLAAHRIMNLAFAMGAPRPDIQKPNWSTPFQKKEIAAKLLLTVKGLNQAVKAGVYRLNPVTREKFQIDLNGLPKAKQKLFNE